MTNGTHAAQSKHLDSLAAAAKRYVLSEILDVTNAVSAEIADVADVEFIEGTQTASTGAWTGVTKDAALYKGKFIIYKLPYAGSGNASLNLTLSGGNKTGAKNIYRYGSTRLTTQYAANYYIPLIYNGTYWFALADYDTNYYDRVRVSNAIVVASGAVQAVCFVGSTDGTNYKQLSAGATFNINYPVYYNSSAVADAANMSTGLYFAIGSVNLQTVVGDNNRTFAAQAPVYLKGTLSGSTFTVHSDILTTTVPASADGYTYLRVGFTYDTYRAYVMLFDNKFFAYTNGAFQVVDPNFTAATASKLGGVKIGQRLSITSDGVLSADDQTYTLPTANSSQLGGVKVGSTLTITNGTLNYSLPVATDEEISTIIQNYFA